MKEIISKKVAAEKGYIYYYTGKPCKNGHLDYRMIKGGACRTCKNNHARQHRINNKEKIKEYHKNRHLQHYDPEKRRKKYFDSYTDVIFNRVKQRAKKYNLSFDLEKEDIVIPEKCPILGIPLVYDIDSKTKENSPSIDRIDNTKGYIKENIQVISNRANRIKSDASIEELEKILLYMKG